MVASAIIAGICSSVANGSGDGILEAACICVMALCMLIIAASADYCKDSRFIKLQSLVAEEECTVVRGKYGSTFRQSVWDLVVGDIVLLSQGDLVPAHCVIIQSNNLAVDETPNSGEIERQPKGEDTGGDADPFLVHGSLVVEGEARALVCCVGPSARKESEADSSSMAKQLDEDTPLQTKMKKLSNQLSLIALGCGIIILIELIIMTFIGVGIEDEEFNKASGNKIESNKSATAQLFNDIPKIVNIVIIFIVVAIPEGLPLTIGVSLAFSVMEMYKENILIRKLVAPEKLGGIEEIIVGKTATITCNDMRVDSFYFEG